MGARLIGILLVLIGSVFLVNCDCNLSLQNDFGSPSPIFLQDGVFLAPNHAGEVALGKYVSLLAACPGDRRALALGNYSTDMQELEAICVSNKTFTVGKWKGQFKDIRCNGSPWFSAQDQQACYGGGRLYKIGYNIQNVFHKVYEACFDYNQLRTLYVKHRLTPVSRYSQAGTRRPQFIEGGLYGKVRMSELYKLKTQRQRLAELLGAGIVDEYLSKNQFLTRGHLAPRGDFIMSAVQRATFHYVNSAPQWMRMNAGDWAAVEDALRRRVQKLNSSITIYTGTHGVLTLKDKAGQNKEVYLTTDENNNQLVPVPLYFYKVAYSPTQKQAVAFVTINSSFYNRTETEALTFCDDVCEDDRNYSWLRWRNDGSHSFCCTYTEFVETVPYLPKLDVKGLFY